MDEFVATSGTGAATAVPDAMRVSMQVVATAATVAGALAAVAEGAHRAGETARQHTDETRISSAGFRVHPAHDDRGLTEGFTASHALLIHCELGAAGRLVTDLGESVGDGLRVDVVAPVVTDTGALFERAQELAFADARGKARQLAALAGRSLGPALQVQEGRERDGGVNRSYAAPASRSRVVDLEAGGGDVTATVSVRWALTD